MMRFDYQRSNSVDAALQAIASNPNATFIAGGTNLLDLMKENVARPEKLIDITRLPLTTIEESASGGLRIGSLVSNADLAYDARVQSRYPLLAQALLAGASPQLRNMASVGGNLLQRTRCYYFYDVATACNKREPGSGCAAIQGYNRIHAVLGASDQCVAVHPSDMCVALAALDATVEVIGPAGKRTIALADFHRLPGDRPQDDTTLARDELVVAVELPPKGFAASYAYLKLRDRASYAFALVSVAAALTVEADGTIGAARIALGGVAHKPWRDPRAEALLAGQPATSAGFNVAAAVLLEGARGLTHNAFKIDLAQRAVVRALGQAAGVELIP